MKTISVLSPLPVIETYNENQKSDDCAALVISFISGDCQFAK